MTEGDARSHDLGMADVLAMTSVASRQDLPERVRELLSGVLGLFWRNLERSLATSLDEFERNLIQQANKPRVGEAGSRCLESIRRIKPTRADVAPRFMLALEDDLAQLDQRSSTPVAKKIEPVAAPWQELSLVGSHELDESLTLREIASRVEIRHSVPLFELGYRFGILAARPAFDVESLPLGPARITAALHYAVATLDLPLDHRVLFYQTFDRFTMGSVGALYNAANTYLAEQGILRYLQVQALQKSRTPASAEARPAATPAHGHAPPRPRGGDPIDVDVGGFGLAAFETDSKRAKAAERSSAPATPAREVRPHHEHEMATTPEAQQFALLRQWLDAYRRREGVATAPTTADSFEPQPRELQAALGVLQVRSPPTMMLGGKIVQRTVAQLRQDLLNQLRSVTPAGQTPRLSDEDTDTIEIVGMLFEQLMLAARPDSRTQSMLTRLQVPILRAALRDKRFFGNPEHPARRLLGSIVDTGTHWLDDGPESDTLLTERLQRTIERINAEFDTDMRVFGQIDEELTTLVGSMARRSEVAERRLVEACRGREKLTLARDMAARAITIRLAAKPASRLLRTLLEQAWIDVLALTLLRQGEKSEAYRRQLAVADQLIATGDALHTMPDQPIVAAWREEIEAGLSQVGYHEDEIQAVVARLFATPGTGHDEGHSPAELAERLKSRMRVGEGADEALPGAAARPSAAALTPQETQTLEQIKAMPFGTWFEVVGAKAVEPPRLRLSWFSPLTGRCLLTNRRGARADERGLDQLARDVCAGKLRVEAQQSGSIIDRCWKNVLGPLEQAATVGGGGDVPLR